MKFLQKFVCCCFSCIFTWTCNIHCPISREIALNGQKEIERWVKTLEWGGWGNKEKTFCTYVSKIDLRKIEAWYEHLGCIFTSLDFCIKMNYIDKSFGHDKIFEKKKAHLSFGINICYFVCENVFGPIFIKTYNDTLILY